MTDAAVRASLIQKIQILRRQPFFVWLWMLPVWSLLGLAKVLILTVSFKRLHPWLGDSAEIKPLRPLIDPTQCNKAKRISHVIRIAARYTPWDSNCFPQAIVARIVLGLYKIPYAMHLGVKRDPADHALQAHAWVCCGQTYVTGGPSFDHFTIVGVFASRQVTAGAA